MSIAVQNVSKRFGDFHALRDVDLEIQSGELVALLGPSGCGKTTLLRIIAGLEGADTGSILFSGEDATDLHVRERNVGFVFQHYALFRHMTVFENVAFGLRVKPRGKRPSEAQIKDKVHDLLKLVQLDWLADRFPAQLSGGQRQRIALARALAVEPKVLLLDEPFGALDAKVRKELRRWLRRLHDELHVTSVFVTHDQDEALEVADRVVLMNAGRIEQVGTPAEVWSAPANPFVYGFLGDVNRFPAHVDARGATVLGVSVDAPGVMDHGAIDRASSSPQTAVAFVRPHELLVEPHVPGAPGLPVRLIRSRHAGALVVLELAADAGPEHVEAQIGIDEFQRLNPQPGQLLLARPRQARVFLEAA